MIFVKATIKINGKIFHFTDHQEFCRKIIEVKNSDDKKIVDSLFVHTKTKHINDREEVTFETKEP